MRRPSGPCLRRRPGPTGLRYCTNGCALDFKPDRNSREASQTKRRALISGAAFSVCAAYASGSREWLCGFGFGGAQAVAFRAVQRRFGFLAQFGNLGLVLLHKAGLVLVELARRRRNRLRPRSAFSSCRRGLLGLTAFFGGRLSSPPFWPALSSSPPWPASWPSWPSPSSWPSLPGAFFLMVFFDRLGLLSSSSFSFAAMSYTPWLECAMQNSTRLRGQCASGPIVPRCKFC